MDRATRFIANRKQDKIRVVKDQPSIQSMREGEEVLFFGRDGVLSRYRKERGQLWRSDMTKGEGNKVGGTLKTSRLEYSSSFVDYRAFTHNFTDDLPDTKIYVPWVGPSEQTALLEPRSSYLTPFNMVCHKIHFRTPAMDTAATDIVFGIEKVDSGDTTRDAVCTFDATASWSDNTNFVINQSDWSATPTVGAGDVIGITIEADNTNIVTSEKHFFMTSVWKVIVTI